MSESLHVTMFEKPSGNVRGVIAAFAVIKGREKRIAFATLLTDEEPSVSLSIPAKVPLSHVDAVATRLQEFSSAVKKADSGRADHLSK